MNRRIEVELKSGAGQGRRDQGRQRRRAMWALCVLAVLSVIVVVALAFMLDFDFSLRSFVRGALVIVPEHSGAIALIFAAVALVSQMLIMPSGSALMVVGGALLGAIPATLVYVLAQMLTTPAVYLMARAGYGRTADRAVPELLQHYLGARWKKTILIVPDEGIASTIALRLMPVFPSAVVCLLAAGLGIALRPLMIGTVLVCWVRPLFFASIGEAAHRAAVMSDPLDFLRGANFTPLLLIFVAALLVLAARAWLRLRTRAD